ncbi:AEC family transporter [Lysinibacillus fusiformis]|jgi:predicted permease|uniref:AEC family transporter n=1 Tax=Lysinibacillus TaxID=400634 RepID=UPI0004D842DE|nr:MULTISPECIES: AEC family transporter [Lysinibacillus]AJK89754.1 transporter [Lysinibacillus fusiformis]KEK13408.1 transporter [Lysinibacillus sphaericus]KHK51809.1 transporter [Lysinibacillus sp. A1]MCE4046668.1 AEC family transporter [Lysinibacillus fusiformis]MCK1990763.1 AEC family transporter [Lysinibacillus fusiformis]
MVYLGMIFFQIVAPILVLLVLGAILQKKFRFNLKALSQLITYCFMPAAVFINLYETNIKLSVLGEVGLFVVLFIGSQMLLSHFLAKGLGLAKTEAAVFKNSVVLINSGNYGIPVAQMIFATQPIGVAIQVILVIFQNMTTYTYGLYNLISSTKSGMTIFKDFIKMPIIHALIIGVAMNYFDIGIPQFIKIPIDHVADGFIAVALITLGAQLSQLEIKTMFNKTVFVSCFTRLFIGPAVALVIIYALGLDGVVAQSLFIASAFPTSRNSSSLALEYDVESATAAQTVLFSTIVSCITVTIVIYIADVLFT